MDLKITKVQKQITTSAVLINVNGEQETFELEPWAKYLAANANGRVRQYEFEPHCFKTQENWFSSNIYGKVKDVALGPVPKNYMDTMIKI